MNKIWKYITLNKKLFSGSFLIIVLFLSIRVTAGIETSLVSETQEQSDKNTPVLTAAEDPFDFLKSPLEGFLYFLPISEESCDEQDERESNDNEEENHGGQVCFYYSLRADQDCVAHAEYPVEVRLNRTSVSLWVLYHSWKSDLA